MMANLEKKGAIRVGFWTFMGLFVICGCAVEAYRVYMKSKSARHGGDIAKLEARVAALESDGNLAERVRTLEAIVTSPKFQLDQELERLRD